MAAIGAALSKAALTEMGLASGKFAGRSTFDKPQKTILT
jgi:hypothetical protein